MQKQTYPPQQQSYPPQQGGYPPQQQQQQPPYGHAGDAVAPDGTQYPPQWTEGLCGCFEDTTICCEEFWCGYCHAGYLSGFLQTNGRQMDMMCCAALCVDAFCCYGLARCCYVNQIRGRVVMRYHIVDEGGCMTCLLSFFCTACAMCQMHREMHKRGDYTGGVCYTAPPQQQPMGVHAAMQQQQQQQSNPYANNNAVVGQPVQQQQGYGQPQYQQQGYGQQPQYGQPNNNAYPYNNNNNTTNNNNNDYPTKV